MLGKSGTLYLAHMNMEDMEPTVGSKFPFNKNVFFGNTLKEAQDKARTACKGDDAQCEKHFSIAQVEFERGDVKKGDSPDTFYVTGIVETYHWNGTPKLDDTISIASTSASSTCSEESKKPFGTTMASPRAFQAALAKLEQYDDNTYELTTFGR